MSETSAGRLRRASSTIGGQATVILSSRVIGALSTAVLTIVLARILGLGGYGDYALALSIAASASLLASLGVDSATARYVADGYNRGSLIGNVIRRGLRLRVLVAAIVFGDLILLADPIASLFGEPDLAGPVRAAAVALFFSAGFQWTTGVYEGVRRGGMLALMSIVKALAEFAAVLTLLLLGFGVVGALVGNALSYAVAVGVGLFLMRPYLKRRTDRETLNVSTSTILRYGSHIWLAGVAWVLFERIDQILLGLFIDSNAVGLYDASWRIAALLALVGLSIASAVTPRFASADPGEAGALLTKALRITIVFYVVLACITAVAATDLFVTVLGAEFARSAEILRVLIPYLALIGLAPILSRGLDFIGVASARKWIALGAFLINFALDLILIPTVGLLGPAIATNAAILFFVAGHYYLCSTRLDLDGRALAGTLVRSCVAAGAGAAVCWAVLMGPGPTLLLLLIAFPTAIVAALAVLVALREIGPDDLPERMRPGAERVTSWLPDWRGGAVSPFALAPAAAVMVTAVVVGAAIGRSPFIVIGGVFGLALVALLLSDITIGVTAFVILSPLVLLGGAFGEETFAKGAGIVLFVTWLVSLFYPSQRRRYRSFLADHPFLVACLVLFSGWAAASLLWAQDFALAVDALPRWALGFLLLAIVFTAARNRRAAIIIAGAFCISAVLSTLFGIATGNTVDGRLAGTLADPNEFAAFCVPALLIGAALAVTADTPLRRVCFAGAAVVCGLGIVISGSRGGIIAISAAIAVWIVFGGRWRLRVIAATLVLAVLAVGYVNTIAPPETRERLATITQDSQFASESGGTGREDIWAVGLRAYEDRPVVGSGVGNYTAATPRYLTEPGLIRRTDFFTETPKVAHNTYLHILVELGLVGLVLFGLILLLTLGAAAGAARRFRRSGDAKMELLTRTVLAGSVGLLTADFFISGQYQRPLWILLGLCAALYSLSERSPVRAAARRRWPDTTRAPLPTG